MAEQERHLADRGTIGDAEITISGARREVPRRNIASRYYFQSRRDLSSLDSEQRDQHQNEPGERGRHNDQRCQAPAEHMVV
jgi:hypothetical protein